MLGLGDSQNMMIPIEFREGFETTSDWISCKPNGTFTHFPVVRTHFTTTLVSGTPI